MWWNTVQYIKYPHFREVCSFHYMDSCSTRKQFVEIQCTCDVTSLWSGQPHEKEIWASQHILMVRLLPCARNIKMSAVFVTSYHFAFMIMPSQQRTEDRIKTLSVLWTHLKWPLNSDIFNYLERKINSKQMWWKDNRRKPYRECLQNVHKFL